MELALQGLKKEAYHGYTKAGSHDPAFSFAFIFKEIRNPPAEVFPIIAVHSIFFRKVFFGACESEPS
ncbi:hypothetical protein [Brucella tritici]|uniref:hypothetical protein n=1 Tax=Brucella tritici TaxID=94626 RepID=UPI001592A87B|nr:hypothetical protein [Brucella tritici]